MNIPILNNKTIVVSPFSGESDICPSDFDVANIVTIDLSCTSMKVSVANFCRIFDALFPPPSEQLKEMCWQGYSDAMQYLIDHSKLKTFFLKNLKTFDFCHMSAYFSLNKNSVIKWTYLL